MKNDKTMFDVRIACFALNSKPRIKWYIGAHGAFDNRETAEDGDNGKVWVSKVIEMNKDELYWVLGAAKTKMIKAKTHTYMSGQRFIVIEAEVSEDSQVVHARTIALAAVRDPLRRRCGMTECSKYPVNGNLFTDLEYPCIMQRINCAIQG